MNNLSIKHRLPRGRRAIVAAVSVALLAAAPGARAQPPAGDDQTAEAIEFTERLGPAARAVLELPRRTPAEYVEAILTLVDLGHPRLARPILEELMALDLTDPQRAELVRQVGSQRLLRLAQVAELAPAGSQFAEASMAAAAAAARDPQRLASLVDQLAAPSASARRAARAEMSAAGIDAVRFVLETLARETDERRRAGLQAALIELDPLSAHPTLAALSTSKPQFQNDLIGVVARTSSLQAAPFLVAPALDPQTAQAAQAALERLTGRIVTPGEAQETLARAIERYRRGVLPAAPDGERLIEVWHWNDETQQLASARFPPREASLLWAARLADDLVTLAPTNTEHRRWAIVLGLEAAKLRQGYDVPFDALRLPAAVEEVVESTDAHQVSAVLAEALEHDYPGAAIAACDLLAARHDPSVLYLAGPAPAPLARAVRHAHPRVAFAALGAIMELDPPAPFAGSSAVPKALAYFANSGGRRGGLVAMATIEEAATLAGMLSAAGFSCEVANNGNDLIQLARRHSDVEFILIDRRILRPGIREVIYQLRALGATGRVPIAILAPDGELSDAQTIASKHRRVIATPRPHNEQAVVTIAERLVDVAGRDYLSPDQRAEFAAEAIRWSSELAARPERFYALRPQTAMFEAALYEPATATAALDTLAALGTPRGQRALVEYASQQSLPIELRRHAAEAFSRSVDQHGILLTSGEILAQYDRYNASESADAPTQAVLGQVLDAIESQRHVTGKH